VHRTHAQHAVGREVVAVDEARGLTVEQPRPDLVAARAERVHDSERGRDDTVVRRHP
jgi:hypothetical protein